MRSRLSIPRALLQEASRGYLDDVIRPQNTRWRICRALAMLRSKELGNPVKKHDNLPV